MNVVKERHLGRKCFTFVRKPDDNMPKCGSRGRHDTNIVIATIIIAIMIIATSAPSLFSRSANKKKERWIKISKQTNETWAIFGRIHIHAYIHIIHAYTPDKIWLVVQPILRLRFPVVNLTAITDHQTSNHQYTKF